jgi:hypothetical protein
VGPRTLQTDLLIHRIGGDLLPVIIGAALSLAYGLVANLLLRVITIRLKDLPTVAATAMVHQAAPEENERNSFSLEAHYARSSAIGVFGRCTHPTIMRCILV